MINDLEEKKETQYRRDLRALEQRRREGMKLLARGVSQAEVARRVGVSRMSVMRWERLRLKKRRTAWARRRLGRPPKRKVRGQRAEIRGQRAEV
jgi:transcriptional regulator with XRE-family HTH domain